MLRIGGKCTEIETLKSFFFSSKFIYTTVSTSHLHKQAFLYTHPCISCLLILQLKLTLTTKLEAQMFSS